jgi:hypothetical protein
MENKNFINKDCMVFSVLYELYERNIKNGTPNNKLGVWGIEEKYLNIIKYAYVYLTDSNGMIVKKYKIDKFEKDKTEKYSFIYSESKDFFIQYPFGVVEKHHYRLCSELDNEEVLDTQEVNLRLDKSRNKIMNRKRVKKIKEITSREKLRDVFLKNFQHQNRKIILKDLPLLDKKVDLGEDANLVLTEYFSKLQNIENK